MSIDSAGPVSQSMAALARWLSTVDTPVVFAAPGGSAANLPGGSAVNPASLIAWPVQLLADQEVRPSNRPGPFRLRVRFLVTAEGAATELARVLDPVLVAAATAVDVAVVLDPVPAELWLAFGVAPRVAVLVDVPVSVARPVPVIAPVREPLHVRLAATRAVRGQVLGPRGEPVPGMRVEAPTVGAGTYTDRSGGFAFGGLPPGDLRLVLVGRGRYFHADVTSPAGEPVVIRCDFEEA